MNKLNHKIAIDMLDFFRTGKFDYITLGKTKEWILHNFPEPDDYAGDSLQKAEIWRYGNIEFYFDGEELTRIYSDYMDSLNAGSAIDLHKWIFQEPQELTLQHVTSQLVEQRIDFWMKHYVREHICQTSVGLIHSCIYLNFQPEEPEESSPKDWYSKAQYEVNPNQHKLCSFSLIDKEELNRIFYQANENKKKLQS